jgi:hypothetical protein
MPPAPRTEVLLKPKPDEFRKALSRLATDAEYRQKAQTKPEIILRDFKLSLSDLQALRQVAVLSGADISAVNKVRAKEIARLSNEFAVVNKGALARTDVDISCCSCCCCCCGETAVLSVAAAGR